LVAPAVIDDGGSGDADILARDGSAGVEGRRRIARAGDVDLAIRRVDIGSAVGEQARRGGFRKKKDAHRIAGAGAAGAGVAVDVTSTVSEPTPVSKSMGSAYDDAPLRLPSLLNWNVAVGLEAPMLAAK